MESELIRKYEFKGVEVGRIVDYGGDGGRVFETDVEEFEAIQIVRDELSGRQRIHMRTEAYGVQRLLEYHGIEPSDYVDDEDIETYVAGLGVRNLTELFRKDHKAWEFVKERGLEEALFPELQPAE